jgi:hypothetical protein
MEAAGFNFGRHVPFGPLNRQQIRNLRGIMDRSNCDSNATEKGH